MNDFDAGRPLPREDLQPYLDQMNRAVEQSVANYRAAIESQGVAQDYTFGQEQHA